MLRIYWTLGRITYAPWEFRRLTVKYTLLQNLVVINIYNTVTIRKSNILHDKLEFLGGTSLRISVKYIHDTYPVVSRDAVSGVWSRIGVLLHLECGGAYFWSRDIGPMRTGHMRPSIHLHLFTRTWGNTCAYHV